MKDNLILQNALKEAPKWLSDNLIMVCEHGSHAYGTSTPKSDLDLRGICLEPFDHVVSVCNNFEQFQKHSDEVDICVFGLRKFIKLAMQCNPNVIELLFVDESSILYSTPQYELLRNNRDMFLTEKARHTFRGYAMSELKKIQSKSQNGTIGKRQATIDLFGYDTKHAMHLVRLMRMGEEILTGKGLIVKRPDAQELLDIRDGKWDIQDLVDWASEKDQKLKDMETVLPWGPDQQKIDDLMRSILWTHWVETSQV